MGLGRRPKSPEQVLEPLEAVQVVDIAIYNMKLPIRTEPSFLSHPDPKTLEQTRPRYKVYTRQTPDVRREYNLWCLHTRFDTLGLYVK